MKDVVRFNIHLNKQKTEKVKEAIDKEKVAVMLEHSSMRGPEAYALKVTTVWTAIIQQKIPSSTHKHV